MLSELGNVQILTASDADSISLEERRFYLVDLSGA